MYRITPTRLTSAEAIRVITDRRPFGTFYIMPEAPQGTVTAIDNRDGYCWTEEFKTLEDALGWINDEFEISEYRQR